jgi:hypothetical protein
MKNIVKLGVFALVATAASLQAAYDEVTVSSFINQIPGHPEIAYRILYANGKVRQDWKRSSQEVDNVNIVLKKGPNGYHKIEFKKVGYDKNGWNLQPYNINMPNESEIYQPSGNNQTLSIGFKENKIERLTGATAQQTGKIRVVKIKNFHDAAATFKFTHTPDKHSQNNNIFATYEVAPNSELVINLLADAPLYYFTSSDRRIPVYPSLINNTVDKTFIDKDGVVNMDITFSLTRDNVQLYTAEQIKTQQR